MMLTQQYERDGRGCRLVPRQYSRSGGIAKLDVHLRKGLKSLDSAE